MISDREGMFGRKCPTCNSYFRADSAGAESLTCPYCLTSNDSMKFFTKNQMEYIELFCRAYCTSVNEQTTFEIDIDALINELPENKPEWIYDERQQNLYTCQKCNSKYDVLDEYSYCPSCEKNNFKEVFSKKIKAMNDDFERFNSEIEGRHDREAKWEELTKSISEFESMGNELKKSLLKIPATKSRKNLVRNLSFQNIIKASDDLKTWFDIDLLNGVNDADRAFLNKMFNRRHIFTHNAGKVDQEYIENTGDNSVRLNQTIRIKSNEIKRLLPLIERCGDNLLNGPDA